MDNHLYVMTYSVSQREVESYAGEMDDFIWKRLLYEMIKDLDTAYFLVYDLKIKKYKYEKDDGDILYTVEIERIVHA